MCDKIQFSIQDLYKTLRRHDKDILKHFDDDELSDYDYLFYALNSDIVSNALSIVINILIGNEQTVGIDNNARAILESFVVLKMLGCGEISETQQKIFRKQYVLVDYENFKKHIKNEKDHPLFVELKKKRDEAEEFLCQRFGCNKKELHNAFCDDPLFYLKKHLKESICFASLLAKYPIYNEQDFKMYDFYSIMVHPKFIPFDLAEPLYNLRRHFNQLILDYVVTYLQESKLIILDDKSPTFDDDFFNNPLLVNNVKNIEQIGTMFDMLETDLCFLKDGINEFDLFFFEFLKHLIKDMMLCESLGYNEQVISKFKSFIELAAVHAKINCAETLDDFDALRKAFCFTTKLQLNEHLKSTKLGKISIELSELRNLYDHYYKNKFNLSSYEEFEKGMRMNSLYFLDPNHAKSYTVHVKNAINELFPEKPSKKQPFRAELFDLYKLSKDVNHASGYNFNSTKGIFDFHVHYVMHAVYIWLINLIINARLVVEENDHETIYVERIVNNLEMLAGFEKQSMEKIGKDYQEDYNKHCNHET